MANAGIGKLRKAMLVYLVGFLVTVVGYFLGFAPLLAAGSSHSSLASTASLLIFVSVMIVGIIVTIVALLLIRSGFKMLATTDSGYGIGALGALLELIGLAFFFLAAVVALVGLASLSSSTSGFGALAAFAGTLLAMLGLFALGALLAFIGVVLILVAFWRVGSKNNSSLIKIGAIFYLLFGLIGVLLLYIGLGELEKK